MASEFESLKYQAVLKQGFSRLLLSKHGADAPTIWTSTFKLYYRPWFRRLWIIQEAALALELVLLRGHKQISWSCISYIYRHAGIDYEQDPFVHYLRFGILFLRNTHNPGLLCDASEHRPHELPT